MHNPEASQRRPAPMPRQPSPAHTGRKPIRAHARPRPERRPKADSVRTEQEKTAGAVRHAEPFARSGRIAASATGGPARRGTTEKQSVRPLRPTRKGTRPARSSPPRESGSQSGEGGGSNEATSFGSLRDGNTRTRHTRRPFGFRRPVGGKPAHDRFEPCRAEIAAFLDPLEAFSARKHDRRKASLAHAAGKAEGVGDAYELLSQVHARTYAYLITPVNRF